ncbi:unnamed protein product [marine sediment metagenome]|uniref:Uncharacterized protein n=1 Tax=marine sediment metagenome TaxID=412755 RepID=X1RA52_9ZZZZ
MSEENYWNRRFAIRDRVGPLRFHLKKAEESIHAASRALAELEKFLKEAEG